MPVASRDFFGAITSSRSPPHSENCRAGIGFFDGTFLSFFREITHIANNSTPISIHHLGGYPLYLGQDPGHLSILVDGVDQTSSFVSPDPFDAGTILSYNSSSMPKTVVMVYHPRPPREGSADFVLKVGNLGEGGS